MTRDDGSPVLRLYEWDRIRRVPFQIDFWLPRRRAVPAACACGSPTRTTTRSRCTGGRTSPSPSAKTSASSAPPSRRYRHDYDGTLVAHDVPIYDGVDVTYTTNRRSAADLYFRIPPRPPPVDRRPRRRRAAGSSTRRPTGLRGRKMFNWGMDPGGRRWQEFLSQPGASVHRNPGRPRADARRIPRHARRRDVGVARSVRPDRSRRRRRCTAKDWSAAYEAVESRVEPRACRRIGSTPSCRASPPPWPTARRPSSCITARAGARWRTVAAALRASRRSPRPRCRSPTSSMTDEQAPWLALLDTRLAAACRPPTEDPGPLMVQPEWRELLEPSIERRRRIALAELVPPRRDALPRRRSRGARGSVGANPSRSSPPPGPTATSPCYRWTKATTAPPPISGSPPPDWRRTVVAARDRVRQDRCCSRAASPSSLLRRLAPAARPLARPHPPAPRDGRPRTRRPRDGRALLRRRRRHRQHPREGNDLSDLWFGWQAKRVAQERGVKVDDDLRNSSATSSRRRRSSISA